MGDRRIVIENVKLLKVTEDEIIGEANLYHELGWFGNHKIVITGLEKNPEEETVNDDCVYYQTLEIRKSH